ncbi:MAG: exonuclease SbcCD subunit D C-terminal domain-containing protein [Chitinispirillaceae bacterium]
MKILHTSDWHLGRSLYGRKRYEEFARFLDWLTETIEKESIDALLVAGDVFDTGTPGNRAQELYYRFLCSVSNSCCRHIVVIAGNHDSPSFLNAPRELLRALNVHVVGAATGIPEDEVVVLYDEERPEAVVCAVPYLRDKDIRTVEPGETIEDKNVKLVEGLKKHYSQIVAAAEKKRTELIRQSKISNEKRKIPLIAMGHLFTTGGKIVDGDGVRELYVGSLAYVGMDSFPSSIDYLALGHLHVPQKVGGAEHIRYSGSPIPMGYGEATQEKSVVIIDTGTENSDVNSDESIENIKPEIKNFPVPCFQPLVRIVGSLDDIYAKIEQLKGQKSRAWLEIEYTGEDITGDLREMIHEALADSEMEICRIKNKRVIDRVMSSVGEEETLDDLDAKDVFSRCLDAFSVPEDDRVGLMNSYYEILQSIHDEDEC